MNNRAGRYVKNLTNKLEYKSFYPSPLPPDPMVLIDQEMLELLLKANEKIAILERVSHNNPFISMYVRKEALMSSQIEGIKATLEDILDPSIEENSNRDVNDVINYIKATNYATERLKTLPLCNRLLKETHKVLMTSVRGQDKNPGEFRTSQNWIGASFSNIKEASYIPPNVIDMNECLTDLESFINNETKLNYLIKVALIHYQFESIHPFLDGNGRIGRLLITLYLMDKKVLSSPALYVSYFLKKHRTEYYDRMSEVRISGNYEQWVKFFIKALIESAISSIESIEALMILHNKNISLINKLSRNKNTLLVFNYLEKNPIINIKNTSIALNLSYNTISKAIENLISLNIVKAMNKNSRNRTFIYNEYLDILRDGTL